MAGSDLDSELRRAANVTAESILDAARSESERMASHSERAIEERRSALKKLKEAEYGADARRAVANERHAAMRDVLMARTQFVRRVLERARALLPAASMEERYLRTLGAELSEALTFVDGDDAVVRCSSALEPAVRRALSDTPRVRVEPNEEMGTGFIVVGAGGSVVVDCQLDTRITRSASALAIEIDSRLQEL